MTLHPSQKKRDVIFVFGKTGMGKSQITKSLIRNYKRVIILDPLIEYIKSENFDDIESLIHFIENKKVFNASISDVTEFDTLSEIVKNIDNTLFVVEEAQRVIPSGATPLPDSFADLIFRGRHTRSNILIVAQRASTVNINARSQWTKLFIFNQSEPKDLAWIENTTGFDIRDYIRELQPLEYFEITPSSYDKKKITKFLP